MAPEVKLPPVIPNVVELPGHITDGLPVADEAGEELPFTVTVTDVRSLTHCNAFHDIVTCPFPA